MDAKVHDPNDGPSRTEAEEEQAAIDNPAGADLDDDDDNLGIDPDDDEDLDDLGDDDDDDPKERF